MNTNELFEFSFVNRTYEKDVFSAFLSKDNNSNVLWIKGKRGVGKTRFIEHVIENNNNWLSVMINSSLEDFKKDILLLFIKELQKYHKLTLLDYVKKHYKSFYEIGKPIASGIALLSVPGLNDIVEYIFDGTYAVLNKQGNSEEPYKIICQYLKVILKQHNLIVILDNFTRCDKQSATIIMSIIKQFIREDNIRFCLVTTDEDMKDVPNLEEELLISIPLQPLKIKALETHSLFYQIMNQNFLMDSFSNDDIIYIHNKCDGNPQQLLKLLVKLFNQEGISDYTIGKARINYEKLMKILKAESFHLATGELSIKQKWVLYTLVSVGKKLKFTLLENIACHISQHIVLLKMFNQQTFLETIHELIEQKILILDASENVLFAHDEYFYDVAELFEQEKPRTLYYHALYDYICAEKTLLKEYNYTESDIRGLTCLYAYKAEETGWLHINYSYGISLFKKHLYEDAAVVFSRLEDKIVMLNDVAIIRIAMCFYEIGKFQDSKAWLDLIDIDELRFSLLKYLYFYYSGKNISNIENDKKEAIKLIKDSLKYIENDAKRKVSALNLLHLYYLETEHGYEQAKEIFYDIKDNYQSLCPIEWANTMRGCQNFIEGKEALDLLHDAKGLLADDIEKAYVTNTEGFVLMKMDEYEKAAMAFQKAYKTLDVLKKHESSYAANNCAATYMMSGKYENAMSILYSALIWSATAYSRLAIQSHLMICHAHLNQVKETEDFVKFFEKYLEGTKIVDSTMCRKIYINLGIAYKLLKCKTQSQQALSRAFKLSVGTASEYRISSLLGNKTELKPVKKYEKFTNFEPWFLIYAHD